MKFKGLPAIFIAVMFQFINVHAQSYDGYTLYFPQGGTKAYLIDLSGNIYHSWTFASNKKTAYASYLLTRSILCSTFIIIMVK